MTRPDHGVNYTRMECPELTRQTSKLMHDLLHGKHDEALFAATGRRGDEIECAYLHADDEDRNLGWEVTAHAHLTLEFREAPDGAAQRTQVHAGFWLYVMGDTGWGPDVGPEQQKIAEEDQMDFFEVKPGTTEPRTLLGTRYDVDSWGPTDRGEMFYCFEKAEPEHQDPPAPPPMIPTPVACDVDLPF